MTLSDEVAVLQDLPPFAALEPAKLKLLAFASREQQFDPGDAMIRQGEKADELYVILEGTVEVSIASDQASRVVRELGPPAFVGEVAILRQSLGTATVTAKTEVRALEISRDLLLRVIEDVPELGRGLTGHMETAGYDFE